MPQMGLMSRALWHVNRTQLRWAVKTGVSAWNLKEKLERRRQAQLLDVTPAEKAKAADLNRDGYVVVTDLMDPAIQQQFADAGLAEAEKYRGFGIQAVLDLEEVLGPAVGCRDAERPAERR